MPDDAKCLKCGAPLTHDARDGACPKCLLGQALATDSVGSASALEFKNPLDDPEWTELDTIPGRGALQSLTDTNAPLSQRFYRVRMQ